VSFFGKQTRALRLRRFPDFKVGFVLKMKNAIGHEEAI
jgi:hypothetical protein